MAIILDGKVVRDSIRERLKKEANTFIAPLKLVIVQVGSLEESNVFIRQKKLFAESIGAEIEHVTFKESVDEQDVVEKIEKLNRARDVHGIIVQMPLPDHISALRVIEAIDSLKDVDGLHSRNLKLQWEQNPKGHMPATARGIISLLDFYEINLDGKNILVIGRSSLVGKPVALALMNRNATVTIAHLHTRDLQSLAKAAEIIVVATGHKHLITQDYVGSGQIIIDVGITAEEKDGKRTLFGDVDFEGVKESTHAITPVPGGVGPLTVASLFENLVDAYKLQQ